VLGLEVDCRRGFNNLFMFVQVSLENGLVLCYDARNLSEAAPRPKYTISAHDGPVSALDVNPHVRGCIATGGMDKLVKIWNVQEEEDTRREISMVTSQDLGVVSGDRS
jgi:periodic tryptophan protein 1